MQTLLAKKNLLLLSIALVAFAIFYNAQVPIYGDEAYYWLWSKHLDIGYYDHPPMIAYAIKLFTVLGDETWKIRLVNVVSFFGAGFFIYKTAYYLFDEKTAAYSYLIFILSPAVTAGLIITTPDSPLLFFLTASMYYAAKAFFEEKTKYFILAGALGGAALLSKFNGILVFLSYLLFIATRRPGLLLTKKPYLAVLFGFLAFLPVIIWNIQNEYSNFIFQLAHGLPAESAEINLKYDLELIGGMLGVFGPVFFVVLIYLLTRKEIYTNERLLFLASMTLITFLVFLGNGVFKKMEINWVAPAFASGSILAGYFFAKKDLIKTFLIGILISFLLGAVIRFPVYFGLGGVHNPQNRLFGPQELAEHIKDIAPDENIYADYLTLASVLTYHLHKNVYIPSQTRSSQFDIWQKGLDFTSRPGIYVTTNPNVNYQIVQLESVWKHASYLGEFKATKRDFRDTFYYLYKVSN
jgi:4-amino-4-deoxy-L-arabinose transferase-like glycosyltransferase